MKLLLIFFIFFNTFSGDNLLVFPEEFPSDHKVIRAKSYITQKKTSPSSTIDIQLGPVLCVDQRTSRFERNLINIQINEKRYRIESEKNLEQNIENAYLLCNKDYILVIAITHNGYTINYEKSFSVKEGTFFHISIYNFCRNQEKFKFINKRKIDSQKIDSQFRKSNLNNFLINNNNQLALYFSNKGILTYDDWIIPLDTEENDNNSGFKQEDVLFLNHDNSKKTTQALNTNETGNVINPETKVDNNKIGLNSNDLNGIDNTASNQNNNLDSNNKKENSKLKLPSTIMKHLINNIKPVLFVLSLLCGAFFIFQRYTLIYFFN